MSARLRLLLPFVSLLALLGGSGCGLFIDLEGADSGTGQEDLDPPDTRGACPTNIDGACVLASDACSPDDLETNADGTACASCVEGNEVIEICGDRTTVQCSQLENAFGEPCQRCVTDDVVLYDDCILAAVPDGDVFCEQVEAGDVQTDAPPEDNGSIVVEDNQDCEVCYDVNGSVVSTSCRPEADTCENVVIDGRACERCTFEGELAYLECEDVDLDPEVCELYESDAGRCIDCYENNTLISHTCTLGDPSARTPGYCETYDTFDGLLCTECFNDDGNLIDQWCEEPPTATFCQQLFFEQAQQECIVCVDDAGQVTESECIDLQCLDEQDPNVPPAPGDCINTTPCTFVEGSNGELCRECAIDDPTGDGGAVERECLDAGGNELVCQEEFDFFDAPGDPDDPNSDPIVEEVLCVRCYDPSGNLVHEECEGMGGQPAPPTCAYEVQPDGTECFVCTDPNTGDVVYDCGGTEPECYEEIIDDQQCLVCDGQIVECGEPPPTCNEIEGQTLVGDNQEPIFFAADNGDEIEAVVDCSECTEAATGTDTYSFASCTLREACRDDGTDPGDPGNGGGMTPGGDPLPPDAICAESNLWLYEIPQCGAPWEIENMLTTPGGALEIQQIMMWLLSQGIVPQSATTYVSGPGEDCAACSCSSGRTLELWTAVNDGAEETLIDFGFQPG